MSFEISTALSVAFSRKVVPVSSTGGSEEIERSVTVKLSPSMAWISWVLCAFLVAIRMVVGMGDRVACGGEFVKKLDRFSDW